jgi:CheY-like chemotaxis protein
MNSGQFQSLRLLTVDDEPISRKMLRMILEKLEVAEIIEAEDGESALQLLAEDEGRIDLVISDVNMPNLDGWELARRIRYGTAEGYKDVPILMVTGDPSDKNTRKARIHKINGFVVKPANRTDLAVLVAEALKS